MENEPDGENVPGYRVRSGPIASTIAVSETTSGATVIVVQGAAAEQPAPVVDQRVTSRVPVMTRMHAPPLHTRSGPHVAPSFAGVAPFSQILRAGRAGGDARDADVRVRHAGGARDAADAAAGVAHEVRAARRPVRLLRRGVVAGQGARGAGLDAVDAAVRVRRARAARGAGHARTSVADLVRAAVRAVRDLRGGVEALLRAGRAGARAHEAQVGVCRAGRPAVQAEQTPPLHTWFVPQTVPFVTGANVSTQVCEPVAQEVSWTVQEFAGVQSAPAVQATHAPLPLQTWLGAAGRAGRLGRRRVVAGLRAGGAGESAVDARVGVGRAGAARRAADARAAVADLVRAAARAVRLGVPVSTQTDVPVEQEVVPVLHGAGFVVHA